MKTTKNMLLYSNNNIPKNDTLPLRKHAPNYTQFYDRPQKNIKRCKIIVDSWDNSKILSNMAHAHKSIKEQPILYYLDTKDNKVIKLKEYLNKHKSIDSKYVYKGTKSQALKKLDRLVNA